MIQFIDVPLPVCAWYAEKAQEMGMGTLDLMSSVLTLYPATVPPPRQPGKFYTPEPLAVAIESGAFLASVHVDNTPFVTVGEDWP